MEPLELHAGDTWTWTRDSADYPASAWTVTWFAKGAAGAFSITGTAEGDTHRATMAKAGTAVVKPGRYDWVARAGNGSEQYTIATGSFEVLPDFTAEGAYDGRSHARKALEAIQAVIERRATLDQEEYSIEGRSLKRTPMADLLMLRARYLREVQAEETAQKLANGLGVSGNKIQVRF